MNNEELKKYPLPTRLEYLYFNCQVWDYKYCSGIENSDKARNHCEECRWEHVVNYINREIKQAKKEVAQEILEDLPSEFGDADPNSHAGGYDMCLRDIRYEIGKRINENS